MKKCTIKIEPGNDTQDVTVKYNDMKSHSISASRMADVIKASEAGIGQSKAVETGRVLFSILDGSGGQLRAEMEKADESGEELALYLDLPPVYDSLPFELLFDNGFLLQDEELYLFRLADPKKRKYKTEPRALRILFMACSPEGQTALNFEDEE